MRNVAAHSRKHDRRTRKLHTHDLTKGNIYVHMAKLSIPLILGNILQQFYNTIDAFVTGRFAGEKEFAAIGVAGTVMNLFLFIMVGACTGLAVLFARYYGTGDYKALRRQHFTALVMGLLGAVALGIGGNQGMEAILHFIQTPIEIYGYVEVYLKWIFLSLPAAFLYNMYASALRACGDTAAALGILGAAVGANLVLDLLLVAGLGLGIQGAAQATALTQLISAVLCICYISRCHKELLLKKEDCRLHMEMMKTTIKCSAVTALHQAGLYIGKMLVQGTVNTAGTEVIGAYTAATRIEGFANSFGDSGSAATSIITSQNYGSGHKERVKKTFFCSIVLTLCIGLACSVLLFGGAEALIGIMAGKKAGVTFEEAVRYLKMIALFYVFCFTGGSFTGANNGTGKMVITLFGTLGQITIRVILSMALFPKMGLMGVAAATGMGWIAANLFWAAAFFYGILKPKLFKKIRRDKRQ